MISLRRAVGSSPIFVSSAWTSMRLLLPSCPISSSLCLRRPLPYLVLLVATAHAAHRLLPLLCLVAAARAARLSPYLR